MEEILGEGNLKRLNLERLSTKRKSRA